MAIMTTVQKAFHKKKAKANASRSESPSASVKSATNPVEPTSDVSVPKQAASEAPHDSNDHPHLREMNKNVRNLNKKLANVAKTETLIAANPDKTLEQLVELKILNADQRAQVLNKPTLLARLAEAEAAIENHKKLHLEYQEQRAIDRKELEKHWEEKSKTQLQEAIAEIKAAKDQEKRDALLLVSKFLAVAAIHRGEEFDPNSDESRALEGCLLQVYSGGKTAVATFEKLISRSQERCMDVDEKPLNTTYAHIGNLAASYNPDEVDTSAEAATTNTDNDPGAGDAQSTGKNSGDLRGDHDTHTKPSGELNTRPNAEVNSYSQHSSSHNSTEPEFGTPDSKGQQVTAENLNGELKSNHVNGVSDEANPANPHVNGVSSESNDGLVTHAENNTHEATALNGNKDNHQMSLDAPAHDPETVENSWSEQVAEDHAQNFQPADDGFTAVQRRHPPRDAFRGRGRGRGRGDFRGRGDSYRGRGRGRGRGMGFNNAHRRPEAPVA